MVTDVALWKAGDVVLVPSHEMSPATIAGYATRLRKKDREQILTAFEAKNFEMASVFVWSRSMALLKKQMSSLGSEFIGEMLQRPDIDEFTEIGTAVTDSEAISLASDLGVVTSTDALRLRHAQEIMSHLSELDEDDDDEYQAMTIDEALGCLRSCVQSVLGRPKLEVAHDFAKFRKQLEEKTFKAEDPEIAALFGSPYFYIKTTLSILLALAKTASGAQLEHAIRNLNIIMCSTWEELRKTEKWQIGQSYAELSAQGKKEAVKGLRSALVKVSGFAYVPETLRSNMYTKAAREELVAHESFSNYQNEQAPMRMLASLGTSIPNPAFPFCMSATLAVWLGNHYGHSWAAAQSAMSVLSKLSEARWAYYLDECLSGDHLILTKLMDDQPVDRWIDLSKEVPIFLPLGEGKLIKSFLRATKKKNIAEIKLVARRIYRKSYGK